MVHVFAIMVIIGIQVMKQKEQSGVMEQAAVAQQSIGLVMFVVGVVKIIIQVNRMNGVNRQHLFG